MKKKLFYTQYVKNIDYRLNVLMKASTTEQKVHILVATTGNMLSDFLRNSEAFASRIV